MILKGLVSQNRNIFTLTVKTATKLLALRVIWKYEIVNSGIKAKLHLHRHHYSFYLIQLKVNVSVFGNAYFVFI